MNVKVYQYKTPQDANNMRLARRWGAREAISKLGRAELLSDTETEVDASVLNAEGFTEVCFDPTASS